ncbi:glucosaminidase domain-containing protein [Paenibacillus sp. 2TAB23]|uniref:SH3 domain-containing protein n=1 Tax=Paenibacillus sp. 2TAB23 TaxID=3233004 RepID=UPI003F9AA3E9
MRKKLSQHLFFYLLILSLVVTLGMYVQPLNNEAKAPVSSTLPAEETLLAVSEPVLEIPTIEPSPALSPASTPPTTQNYASIIKPTLSTNSPPEPVQISQNKPNSADIIEDPLPTYEVTAFYLNIRKEPNAKSEILSVVKQGTPLMITKETANGWLALKDGGFVHGGYAKKMKNEVSILSVPASSNRQPTIAIVDNGAQIAQQSESIDEGIETEKGESAEEKLNAPTSFVESDSGLTEEHIATIFEGTALSGHDLEQAILEIEDEYGINAYFTIAVMKLESGNGKSRLAKSKNNLFGLNAIDGDKYNKAFSFETKGDSVRKFGQLLSKNYVGKGLTTIEKVARKYCPANSKWSSLVKTIMKSDYRKL